MRQVWRLIVLTSLLGAACAVPGDVDVPNPSGPEFGEESVEALVARPTCDEADLCPGGASLVRPQCAATAAEGTFGFEAVQTFNVPRSGTYNFVRVAARAFRARSGLLRIEVREPTGGLDTLPSAPVRAVAKIPTALMTTDTGSVIVPFVAPAELVASTGAPRYALWFLIEAGPTSVGLGCLDTVGAYAEGAAAWRKSLHRGGTWSTGPWKPLTRDLFFAIGQTALSFGACATTIGATCEDGNTNPGDGCDANCHVESGFACTGIPSDCINGTSGPYNASTGATATASTVYSYALYGPERLLDGVKTGGYQAGWLSADNQSYPIYVTINLGQRRRINRVDVTQADDNSYTTKDFDIHFSLDNANWVPAGSNTLPLVPRARVRNTFGPYDFQYLRLTINSGYRINGYDTAGLAEVELFGP